MNGLSRVGPVMLRRLLESFENDPVAILQASPDKLLRVKGVGDKAMASIRSWNDRDWLERERRRLNDHGARFITMEHEDFPQALLETFDPPIGLYCRGNPPREPCVAIVGTGCPSLYGLRMAGNLASGLARAGFCIVSGMARGIDVIYPPENLELYLRIVESGAVFSEFSFGRRVDRQTFPMRNRLVARMSAGGIVVESAENGGSLITARFAGEQGRQVFAVPGRVDQSTAAGCNKLIREGATLISSAGDVVEELAPALGILPVSTNAEYPVSQEPPTSLSSEETAVCGTLADGTLLKPDGIAEATKLPVHEVVASLTLLELKRLVSKHSDGSFEVRQQELSIVGTSLLH